MEVEKEREMEMEQKGNGKGNTRGVLAMTHASPKHDVSMTRDSPEHNALMTRNSPDHGALVRREPRTPDTLMMIFAHWKKVMNLPHAVLDKKRRESITQALAMGYTVEQLCHAIEGCSHTPHNMGKNEQGQRYDGLHIIFRDADQIERFIRNFYRPPQLQKIQKTQKTGGEREQASIKNLQNWLDKKTKTQEIHNFEATENTKNAGWEEGDGNQ
jgi:hypothetical protein